MSNPLVSYCLVTYNQEGFIREAIQSAFDQEYDNLEIIISDDCSSDGTVAIIDEMVANYKGKHKIIVNKNNPNLGIREHFNKLWYEIASGDIIVLAGGDDISDPMRTKEYVECFNRFSQVMSVSCKSMQTDEKMNQIGGYEEWDESYSIFTISDYISFNDFLIFSGDSRALRRDVIEKFGPMKYGYAEDYTAFIRSLLLGSICYIRKPLVKRRNHTFNVSKQKTSKKKKKQYNQKGQLYEDLNTALENGYISKYYYDLMKSKVDYALEMFALNSSSKFDSVEAFKHYILGRLFHVRKVRR